MADPIVSVVMPAYNAGSFVAEAIESIQNQTFTDFEFIIVDDCSNDTTASIIQEYANRDDRIIFIQNEINMKVSKTANKGIAIARGKYVARMDADDWSYPDRLSKQVDFMEANPNIVLSGGTMEVCDEEMTVLNKRKYNLLDKDIRRNIFRYSPFSHSTTIFKTEALKIAGGYNERLTLAEDYDLYFRIGNLGSFGNLDDTLLKLRVHTAGASISNVRKQEIVTMFVRLKAVIEYDYSMSNFDKFFFIIQLLSMIIIPPSTKFWLFNWLRNIIK